MPARSMLETLFHRAAKEDCLDVLKRCDARDCNLIDELGMTPTHWASYCGNIDSLRIIAGKGGDIEKPDNHGNMALHYAAMNGNLNCVSFLEAFGANLWALNNDFKTALDVAALRDHYHIVHFLDGKISQKILLEGSRVTKLKTRSLKEATKRIKVATKRRQSTHKSYLNEIKSEVSYNRSQQSSPILYSTINGNCKKEPTTIMNGSTHHRWRDNFGDNNSSFSFNNNDIRDQNGLSQSFSNYDSSKMDGVPQNKLNHTTTLFSKFRNPIFATIRDKLKTSSQIITTTGSIANGFGNPRSALMKNLFANAVPPLPSNCHVNMPNNNNSHFSNYSRSNGHINNMLMAMSQGTDHFDPKLSNERIETSRRNNVKHFSDIIREGTSRGFLAHRDVQTMKIVSKKCRRPKLFEKFYGGGGVVNGDRPNEGEGGDVIAQQMIPIVEENRFRGRNHFTPKNGINLNNCGYDTPNDKLFMTNKNNYNNNNHNHYNNNNNVKFPLHRKSLAGCKLSMIPPNQLSAPIGIESNNHAKSLIDLSSTNSHINNNEDLSQDTHYLPPIHLNYHRNNIDSCSTQNYPMSNNNGGWPYNSNNENYSSTYLVDEIDELFSDLTYVTENEIEKNLYDSLKKGHTNVHDPNKSNNNNSRGNSHQHEGNLNSYQSIYKKLPHPSWSTSSKQSSPVIPMDINNNKGCVFKNRQSSPGIPTTTKLNNNYTNNNLEPKDSPSIRVQPFHDTNDASKQSVETTLSKSSREDCLSFSICSSLNSKNSPGSTDFGVKTNHDKSRSIARNSNLGSFQKRFGKMMFREHKMAARTSMLTLPLVNGDSIMTRSMLNIAISDTTPQSPPKMSRFNDPSIKTNGKHDEYDFTKKNQITGQDFPENLKSNYQSSTAFCTKL